jgi:hypothetical protein
MTRYMLDQSVQYFSDRPIPLEDLRQDHVYLYNLLGDPATRIFFPEASLEFQVEHRLDHGRDVFLLKGGVPARFQNCEMVATLELPLNQLMVQSARKGREEPAQVVRKYYEANRKVLARRQSALSGQTFEFLLQPDTPLEPGVYYLKLAVSASGTLAVGCQLFRKN